jgi:proteasome lid subunit RPN8/RPN11
MVLTTAELGRIRAQAEAEYPAECCGVVLVRGGRDPERVLMPCRNAQDEKHREDPVAFPRQAREAYYMDPRDLLVIGRREAQGYAVAVIYHSHIDVGAYFSATDKQNALMDGQPTYPDAIYVVVSVMAGRAEDARAFVWSAASRDFVPAELSTL